ncbi:MAG: GNAT family N-acetyltransferase [Elusimicrobiales bacterium]
MITYRFLKRPDAKTRAQLIEIYREQGWWKRDDKPALLGGIVKGSRLFLAAFDGGRAVGMARAIDAHSREAYIHDVAVLRAARGRDIGSQLVRRLVRRLRAGGIRWVGLIASSGSAPFYRALGFTAPPDSEAMMIGGPHA